MTGGTEMLRRELAGKAAIPFVRFMELALYHPEYGYYERSADVIGKEGDFYTNVSTGSLFGELLASQFKWWLEGGQRPVIVETGAHDGRLAGDILSAFEAHHTPVEYWIVEPSAKRVAWQTEVLGKYRPQIRWFSNEQTLPQTGISGVILAHELLDAFPRHRIGWDADAQQWFEWGGRWGKERFEWVRLPNSAPRDKNLPGFFPYPILPEGLLKVLPDGFTTETCPQAEAWWGRMAQRLQRGCLVAVDYGLETLDFFQPHRAEGTLRSYYRHHLVPDVLLNPGEQDITAMVDFSGIRRVGEQAGLTTVADERQARFLTRIFQRLSQAGLESWSPAKVRQFMTLTHEEHLGGAFRVLAQVTPR